MSESRDGQTPSDEPPVRAIGAAARVIGAIAEDVAADERRAHEQAFHSGERPLDDASAALQALGNADFFVKERAEQLDVQQIASHELNYHGHGVQAFDGYALVEQINNDPALARLVRAALELG